MDIFEIKDKMVEIALVAGEIIKSAYFKQQKQEVSSKGGVSSNLVTLTDKKCEATIISFLTKAYPKAKFIAEESENTGELTDCPTFIIDPLDGTTNFVHSFPHVAVSIAYCEGGKSLVCVVWNPILKEKFTAIRGKGAFFNDKRVQINGDTVVEDVKDALLGSNFPYFDTKCTDYSKKIKFKEMMMISRGFRMIGCASLLCCYVGTGSIDVYFEKDSISIWDIAASSLFVTECGGKLCKYDGSGFELKSIRAEIIAASSGSLLTSFLTKLKQL